MATALSMKVIEMRNRCFRVAAVLLASVGLSWSAASANSVDVSLGSISSATVAMDSPTDFTLVTNSDGTLLAVGERKEGQDTVTVSVTVAASSDPDYTLTTPSASATSLSIPIGGKAPLDWVFSPKDGAKDEKGEKKKKINGTITVYASDFQLLLNGQPSDGKTVLFISSAGSSSGSASYAAPAATATSAADDSVTARVRSSVGLNFGLDATNQEVAFEVADIKNVKTGDHKSKITPEKPSADVGKTTVTATEQSSSSTSSVKLTVAKVTPVANVSVLPLHRFLALPGLFLDIDVPEFAKYMTAANQFAFPQKGPVIVAFAPNVPLGVFRYGISFDATATVGPAAVAVGSYWWQEKMDMLAASPAWVQDGSKPIKTSASINGSTSMSDSPSVVVPVAQPTTATVNGIDCYVYTFPAVAPGPPIKKSMRYRAYFVTVQNGVEVTHGYFEYGYEVDPDASPPVKKIEPVWHPSK